MKLALRSAIAVAAMTAVAATTASAGAALRAQGGQYPVKAKIKTGGTGPGAVAVDALANRLYEATGDRAVSVISTVTDRVIKTLEVATDPKAIAVDARAGRVYVASVSGTVSVIGVRADRVIGTITVAPPGFPEAITADPATNLIYVASTNDFPSQGNVVVINGSTLKVISTITVPEGSFAIAVNVRTDMIYDAIWPTGARGEVAVINGHTNDLTKTIAIPTTGIGGVQMAVDERADRLYVPSSAPHAVIVINGRTNDYQTSFPMACIGPFGGIAENQQTRTLYATCRHHANELSAIDAATGKQQTTIPTGIAPTEVAYSGHALYETNKASKDIWVITTPS